MDVTRRTFTRGAAWGVPVIAVAVQAPVFAASSDPLVGVVEASKCPGKSTKEPDTVIVTFSSSYALTGFTKDNITALTVNGAAIPVERVVVQDRLVHVVTVPRNNSADAAGVLVIEYTIAGQSYIGTFAYDGSHPNHELCKLI